MNCEEARRMLDSYIDGELSKEEICALKDHARACEMCARELEEAELLRDALAHMDDDVQVPLEAQAAWRNAVRSEAKKKNTRKWLRAAYAAAAALVLLLGGTAVMRENVEQPSGVMKVNEQLAVPLVARDGMQRSAVQANDDYTAWRKISSTNREEDRQTLEMLAAEYYGSFSESAAGVFRIELPGEYAGDFLNAASRVGEELYSETLELNGETAVIIIQFSED